MSENTNDLDETDLPEIDTENKHIFQTQLDTLIKESEDFRLQRMQEHQSREFMSLTIILLSVVLGAGGFGWYLLVMGNIGFALLCMMVAALPHLFLNGWVQDPIRTYKDEYKKQFMPRLAKIMGGLKFYPKRGISRKTLAKTAIVPAHETYRAEDCFSGKYKGAKITFSEARLRSRSQKHSEIFDGIFVLIELDKDIFKGHSVITTDGKMAQRLMKKFTKLPVSHPPYDTRFTLLSTEPSNDALDNEGLFKEFSETVDLFKDKSLSAAFFAKKYIFIMIPCKDDMFEPSDMHIPITTNEAAIRFRKEVEQLVSIIDVIRVYKN